MVQHDSPSKGVEPSAGADGSDILRRWLSAAQAIDAELELPERAAPRSIELS